MAQRTTQSAVEAILGDNYDASTDLSPFISTAVAITDKLVALDTENYLTTSLKERIEAYLAAHYYQHHDQNVTAKTVGKSSDKYSGEYGMGFKSTRYGQTALELDLTGQLATIGKRKPKVKWLGLPPSEQTDYRDRD